MKKYIYLSLLFSFAASLTFFTSCRKKGDTIAKITVKDTSDAVVSGARVIVYGTSTTDPIKPVVRRDTAYTDANGVALFNYNEVYQLGQSGVAVLDILAQKDSLAGQGIIKIVEEQDNFATVFIQPQ